MQAMDVHELIKQGPKRARKNVPVCLREDLYAEWEDLNATLEAEAESQGNGRKKLSDGTSEAQRRMESLLEEMHESTVTLTLEAMPYEQWANLLAEHPPREDRQIDQALGVNEETFFAAVLPDSIVEPDLTEDEKLGLLHMLSTPQFADLANAVYALNRKKVDIPLSSAASQEAQSSAPMSRRQSDSASATGGSRGGNRKK